MPAGKVKRRPGRPPGAKNKPKPPVIAPEPVIARSNGVRKRAPRTPRVSFLQVSPRHQKLIQKWSNETKIGMQQVLDDIILAGVNAAYKSFYRGLINSRLAAEAQFDAETNTEGLAEKADRQSERVNGLSDSGSPRPAPRPRIDEDQLDLIAVGPGHSEEISSDFAGPFTIETESIPLPKGSVQPDAPPTTPPQEEEDLGEEDTEPPY